MVLPASSMVGQKLGTALGPGSLRPAGTIAWHRAAGQVLLCDPVSEDSMAGGRHLKKNAERGGGPQSKLIMIPLLEALLLEISLFSFFILMVLFF